MANKEELIALIDEVCEWSVLQGSNLAHAFDAEDADEKEEYTDAYRNARTIVAKKMKEIIGLLK